MLGVYETEFNGFEENDAAEAVGNWEKSWSGKSGNVWQSRES